MKNYQNGNYLVSIDYSGTKIRRAFRFGEEFMPEFPESIDLKITNKCSHGCPFCHENSTPTGKSFDLEKTKLMLSNLPPLPIELAIGGGNVLDLSKSELIDFIDWCLKRNFLPRLTINYEDMIDPKNHDLLLTLKNYGRIHIGVSINYLPPKLKLLQENEELFTNNTNIFHIIVGIFPLSDFDNFIEKATHTLLGTKILILGYKQFGRASSKPLDPTLQQEWTEKIKQLLYKRRSIESSDNLIISFDNLALEQLDIRSTMLDYEWEKWYGGDEFSTSMYIDAVEATFAPTSRSTERVRWEDFDYNPIKYFQTYGKPFIYNKA